MKPTRLIRLPILVVLAMVGALCAPKPAQAHIGFRFLVGPPVVVVPPVYDYYYPAPVYYSPPGYYDPPPVFYYPPPANAEGPAGYSCYAGPYVCPLEKLQPVGGYCACPAYGGRSAAGTVR
jgi:hypothetical protein